MASDKPCKASSKDSHAASEPGPHKTLVHLCLSSDIVHVLLQAAGLGTSGDCSHANTPQNLDVKDLEVRRSATRCFCSAELLMLQPCEEGSCHYCRTLMHA